MSEIKVNKISPRTNCGTTTLGDSGDTFTIPAGVTITNNGTANGFGATGAVNWQTTVKAAGFTAVAGEGYFVNTTSGAISVNLPAGTAGAVVGFKDYAGTFSGSNKVTLVQNGSDKIGGETVNAELTIAGQAVTLVFVDSTEGWLVTDSGLQSDASTSAYVTATGGTTTTCGDFKIHTFTGPGTFCVSSAGNACGSNSVEYLIVAGGGGGANSCIGGGGGAGGFRFASPSLAPLSYPAKPLAAPANAPVTAQGYPVVVGAGGAGGSAAGPNGSCTVGVNGSVSSAISIQSAGGGGGGGRDNPPNNTPPTVIGQPGGSGGGSDYSSSGGTGNTPPVSPPQGQPGGTSPGSGSPAYGASGGGGAIAAGAAGSPSAGGLGGDGAGVPTAFGSNGVPCGSFRYYAGGGGGAGESGTPGPAPAGFPGGKGGGGKGGTGGNPQPTAVRGGGAGTANSGGGGGGTDGTPYPISGAAGGSGIVIIRYKFQN